MPDPIFELSEGTRVVIRSDPDDPRFDLVELRIGARAQSVAGSEVRLEGWSAATWIARYFLTQAAQCVEQLGARAAGSVIRDFVRVFETIESVRRRDASRRP